MGVGAVEADRRRSAAIGAAGIRPISRVTMMVIVIMTVVVAVIVAMMAMSEAADPEHPRAVAAAAGVRIAGITDLLETIGATIDPRSVHRRRRDRKREDRLGDDHEAGGEAAERGHGGESERPAR